MVDPITTIASATKLVTELSKLLDPLKNAELTLKVAELTEALATTKTTMAGLIDEVRQLKATIAAHSAPSPTIKNDMYYFGDDGPFCTVCFDKNEKQIRLAPLVGGKTMLGKFSCNSCQTRYGEPEYS